MEEQTKKSKYSKAVESVFAVWKKNKVLILILLIVLIFWLATFKVGFYLFDSDKDKWNRGSQIGDWFGTVNALFSGLALGFVVYSISLQYETLRLQRVELRRQRIEIKLQRRELKLQREEMELQREEMSKSTEQFKEQNRIMMVQKFEGTFFQTIKILEQHISRLIISKTGHKTHPQQSLEGVNIFINLTDIIHHSILDKLKGEIPKGNLKNITIESAIREKIINDKISSALHDFSAGFTTKVDFTWVSIIPFIINQIHSATYLEELEKKEYINLFLTTIHFDVLLASYYYLRININEAEMNHQVYDKTNFFEKVKMKNGIYIPNFQTIKNYLDENQPQ